MSERGVENGGLEQVFSNPEKVLYPAAEFKKAQVIDYYRRVAPFMLPHLKDHALTMKRFPDGVEGEHFFEKRCPAHRPAWVQTAEILRHGGEAMRYCVVNDLRTLLWVANLAALELHVPLARSTSPETPDAVVFDLDPGEGADVLHCARVALILNELFSRLGLRSFVKTSGGKGLHVFVPLNRLGATFEETKIFSRAVAVTLQKRYPELVTHKMDKTERVGRVFINWEQNDPNKTMIAAYSLRAREKPFVSLPLAWEEVATFQKEGDPAAFHFDAPRALLRVDKSGDLLAQMLTLTQALPHL